MDSNELRSMSTDELWDLFEKVNSTLAAKIEAEKAKLNERRNRESAPSEKGVRRPYPPVVPNTRTLISHVAFRRNWA